ncbi:MAG TPA: hypothetical protein DHK64_13700, partial [Rhodobiaceae bacterium]|nr:hypothetical protein [Rhodobiaceae bacterium]
MTYHHGNLRKVLLDRAAAVIAEEGIEALSLRALARDIGVSHAAPARHFKDRADLLRALATEGNHRLLAYVLAAADAAGTDPLVRYNALGQAYVRFSLEFPAYYRTITHPEVAAEADEELRQSRESWHRIITDAARKAQDAGWLPDEDVEDIVIFSTATVRGIAAMLGDPMQERLPGGPERDAFIERMVRLIIDPAAPQ